MRKVLVGAFGLWATLATAVAQGPGPTLQFSFERGGELPRQYTLVVSDRGEGVYRPHLAADTTTEPSGATALQDSPKALRVSPAIVKKLFAAVPMVEGGRCETHNKSIAQTGVKTLRYVGLNRDAQCTYNYSDDDRVNDATSAFEALAETMSFGERLQSKLRFDRLGLDTELENLEAAAAAGRALEIGNIAPVLNAVVQDDRVMERARRRAEKLLAGTGAEAGQGAARSSAQ